MFASVCPGILAKYISLLSKEGVLLVGKNGKLPLVCNLILRCEKSFIFNQGFSLGEIRLSELLVVSPYLKAEVSPRARKGIFAFTPAAFRQVVTQRSRMFLV